MSNLKKRLASVEERIELQQHRDLQREIHRRPDGEVSFFCIYGYWPENATELPHRIEFTARGIKTVVTTEWAGESHKA